MVPEAVKGKQTLVALYSLEMQAYSRMPVMTFGMQSLFNLSDISFGLTFPSRLIRYAIAPETFGEAWSGIGQYHLTKRKVELAMDVPSRDLVEFGLPIKVERTSSPGAQMSTTDPKLENHALESSMAVAPTVTNDGIFAGIDPYASFREFPAEATT